MISCPICLKEFKDRRIFGLHLSRTHRNYFSNDLEKEKLLVDTLFGGDLVEKIKLDYVNCRYCINNLPIDISKYITLLGIKRTSKQERSTERYKQTYTKSIFEKYGVDNISKSDIVQAKKVQTIEKKHGSYEKYLEQHRDFMTEGYKIYNNDEHRKEEQHSKAIATYISKFGCDNPTKNPLVKSKLSHTQKNRIAKLTDDERLSMTSKARESVSHRGGYSSKPEKRVRKSLIDLNIEACYNKHIWNYNWDLVVGKFLIEVQGTMWHAKPGLYKETDLIMGKLLAKDIWLKDAKKHKKAKEEGYTVIEIWEDEIAKYNDEELTTFIKERLENNGFLF
jgi:G:T-mismatch repair DNA endonuclease (very short patch repair protein)